MCKEFDKVQTKFGLNSSQCILYSNMAKHRYVWRVVGHWSQRFKATMIDSEYSTTGIIYLSYNAFWYGYNMFSLHNYLCVLDMVSINYNQSKKIHVNFKKTSSDSMFAHPTSGGSPPLHISKKPYSVCIMNARWHEQCV